MQGARTREAGFGAVRIDVFGWPAVAEEAARILAAAETDRRTAAGELRNPAGYLRRRQAAILTEHSARWLAEYETEPCSARDLADMIEAQPPQPLDHCDACGWTLDSGQAHTIRHSEFVEQRGIAPDDAARSRRRRRRGTTGGAFA